MKKAYQKSQLISMMKKKQIMKSKKLLLDDKII
jgi:hypothetical protein